MQQYHPYSYPTNAFCLHLVLSLQVQQYHQSALAELRSTRQEMERGADPRAEYKAAVESILGGVEEQVGQLRKRFKLT